MVVLGEIANMDDGHVWSTMRNAHKGCVDVCETADSACSEYAEASVP